MSIPTKSCLLDKVGKQQDKTQPLTMQNFDYMYRCRLVNFIFGWENCGNLFIDTLNSEIINFLFVRVAGTMPKSAGGLSHGIITAFLPTSKASDRYKNKWLSGSNWIELIKHHNPAFKDCTKGLNRAFSKTVPYKTSIQSFGGAECNATGLFREEKFVDQRQVYY